MISCLKGQTHSFHNEALERTLTIKQTLVQTVQYIPELLLNLQTLTLISSKQKMSYKKTALVKEVTKVQKKSFPIIPVFHLWSSLSSKCHLATSQRTFLLLVLGQEYEQVEYPELPQFYSSDLPVLRIKTKKKYVISTAVHPIHSFIHS